MATRLPRSAPVTSKAGFALSDTGALSVAGAVTDATSVGLNASALALSGTLSAPSVTLTATDGGIDQTAGAVAAGTLTGSSVTTAALTSTGRRVGTLAGFTSNGGFTQTDSTGLAGPNPVGPNMDHAECGRRVVVGVPPPPDALSLTATGAITQPGGAITAASLTGSAGSASRPDGQHGRHAGRVQQPGGFHAWWTAPR